MILYVNSCVRTDSRTDRIARELLKKLGGEVTELYLPGEDLQPLSREALDCRTRLIGQGDYADAMFRYAKQFALADRIVIAAPYWDLSFPAVLKTYIENIYATGVVSSYGPDGRPVGLCRAKELIYVTTAGGPYVPTYSYDYLRCLAVDFFGIPSTRLIAAEMLDVDGMDAEAILRKTIESI